MYNFNWIRKRIQSNPQAPLSHKELGGLLIGICYIVYTCSLIVNLLLIKKHISKEERLRSHMESTPFIAPMGRQDITNPQSGYTHSPGGIEGGQFLFIKENDFIEASRSKPIAINFKKISYYTQLQPELASGFTSRAAACSYGFRKPGQWTCLLFRSPEDAQQYFKKRNEEKERSPVPFVVCLDCKPSQLAWIERICPGVYSSWMDGESDWKDPTLPGPIFTKGMCTYQEPWWRTEKGIQQGVRKFDKYIK